MMMKILLAIFCIYLVGKFFMANHDAKINAMLLQDEWERSQKEKDRKTVPTGMTAEEKTQILDRVRDAGALDNKWLNAENIKRMNEKIERLNAEEQIQIEERLRDANTIKEDE